jgi:hypothetical protein
MDVGESMRIVYDAFRDSVTKIAWVKGLRGQLGPDERATLAQWHDAEEVRRKFRAWDAWLARQPLATRDEYMDKGNNDVVLLERLDAVLPEEAEDEET